MTLPAASYAQTLNWLKLKQPRSVSSLKAFWVNLPKLSKIKFLHKKNEAKYLNVKSILYVSWRFSWVILTVVYRNVFIKKYFIKIFKFLSFCQTKCDWFQHLKYLKLLSHLSSVWSELHTITITLSTEIPVTEFNLIILLSCCLILRLAISGFRGCWDKFAVSESWDLTEIGAISHQDEIVVSMYKSNPEGRTCDYK